MSAVHRKGQPLATAIKAILSVASCVMVANAFAADDSASGLEEVVVTGFRASLDKALDEKKASAAAIDTIKAEDLAKFPDSNLAEAMQRVPGVSISRDAGEGRNITVRGLGPQYTRVRINGMEAMSTTGGTDSSGGANRDRGFDFNVFASELFGSLTARKTASADVEEGSLGATVDLATPHPLDHNGFTLAASAQGVYNDLSKDTDPKLSALISNTWADGTFGALLSAAYSSRHLFEEGSGTVRWDNGPSPSAQGWNPASNPTGITLAQANSTSTFHPRIPRYGRLTHDQDRLGFTGSLQWAPSDRNQVTLDALYSDFNAKREEQWLEGFSFSRNASQLGKPQTIIRAGEIDANGNLAYGLFDAVDVRSEDRYDELETEFYSVTLSGKHELTDRLTLTELFGYSDSAFSNPIQTTVTLDRANTNGYSWDYRGSTREPEFNYGFDVADPANWAFANGQSEIRLRPQYVDNTFKTAAANLEFRFNDTFSLKGGLSYKEYTFDSKEYRRASETTVPNLPTGTTVADVSGTIGGFGSGLSMGTTPTVWLAPSINAFDQLFDIYCNCGTFALQGIQNASARGNWRTVDEKDSGAFMQGIFHFDTAIPIRGDFGVRYVKTKQESTGYAVQGTVQQANADHDYSDTLPSLNVVAELQPDLLLRFGAAKVMSRPGLGSVTPGGTLSLVGNLAVTSGNPNLDPIRAKTGDLSLEWYFSKGSLLSAAIFYKDIDSFIQTLTETKPFNQSGLPLSLLAGTSLTGEENFLFTSPVNSPGGPLKGAEVNYQQQFNMLPGFWSHFGVLLNYTYVDSKIDYYITPSSSATVENDLLGLSRNAYGATLFYEDQRFSVRVSAAHRDRYLTKVPASNAGQVITSPPAAANLAIDAAHIQDSEGTNATLNVDLSASFTLNEHLMFTLEGINLTDEFNDQFIDTNTDRSVVYTHTGREYLFGARYKF